MGVDELSLVFDEPLRTSVAGQARMDAARAAVKGYGITLEEAGDRVDSARFDGETFVPELDGERLSGQLDRVWSVMKDGSWRTLDEIGVEAGAPPASVSARLRDLRKPRFGGWTVERRRRGLPKAGIFEYRVVLP